MLSVFVYVTFLKIGLLGFGGGYMMLPLFFLEIVEHHHWLTHNQVFNIIAVAQTVPGTFATNVATMVGLNMGSPVYAVAAALGMATPAFIAAYLADTYVRPWLGTPKAQRILQGISVVVIAIIAGTAVNMMKQAVTDVSTAVTLLLAFYLSYFRKWNIAAAMVVASLIGFGVMISF